MEQKEQIKVPCPVYHKCGGCQMLHLSYKKQLKKKRQVLAQLLAPYGEVKAFYGMEVPQHYRHKVNAAFGRDTQGKIISGTYKENSHQIIPVTSCLIENEKADAIIQTVKGLLRSFKIKTYDEDRDYGLLRHVMVRVGYATGQIMVVLVLASPVLPSKNNFVKALRREHPEITTVVVNVNAKRTSMVLGEKEQVIYGPGYIEDELCGMRFKISPRSFYQVNPQQAQLLYNKAIECARLTGREKVIDAYCGTGTIGLIAARQAESVLGIELNRDAVKDAIINARKNAVSNIRFLQADAGEFMEELAREGGRADLVFLDPPRSGSSREFLTALVKVSPDRIIYISCNPQTLARDLEYLCASGYKLHDAAGVDMFPYTEEIEAVCELVLRKR